jgi:peptide/nickel transport system substrate-binding protein
MKCKTLARAIVALAAVSLLAGCGGNSGKGHRKDAVTLVVNADIATLDPTRSASLIDSQVYCNIYDQLVKIDKSGATVPVLAESWKASEDGKSYTFNLRKGVKFHNGDQLKASDVVFSFESAMKSPYLEGQFTEIGKVSAVDDSTVRVDLKSAYAPFLGSLNDCLYVLDEKAVKAAGDKYGEEPVGTGPYKLVKHETGVSVTLERFDGYWGAKPPIKDVTFKVIGDQNTAVIALKTGEVDYVFEVPAISKEDIGKNQKLALYTTPTIRVAYVVMNTSAKPFNNVALRQAVNYAVDKNKAITVATEGMASPTAGVFSKDIFGYSEIAGYEYSPEKAKELLAKAGYAKGLTVSFKTMAGPLQKVAQSVQEDLGKAGITANLEVLEKNAYIQSLAKGDYAIGDISCSVGADADYYGLLFQTGSQANFSHYSNAKIDKLFDEGRVAVDKDKRLGIYKELAQALSDEAVIVPLYYPLNLSAGNANLEVGYMDPIEILYVNEMSWKK